MRETPFKFQLSSYALIVMIFLWVGAIQTLKVWKTERGIIISDVALYYQYLPAFFIYHDISLSFADKPENKPQHNFIAISLPNNKYVIKMSMGLSMMYLPFFMIAHLFCKLTGQVAKGFSDPYEILLIYSSVFYAIIGFVFLGKLLKLYFNEIIVSLCFIVIGLGTNFFIYTTKEACMSHVYLFCLFNIFAWFVHLWYEKKTWKNIFIIGITGGLIALIRPTNILVYLIFILYDIRIFQELKIRFRLFLTYKRQILFLFLMFFLVWAPQFFYWKMQTGQWLFFSYVGERFYFGHPHFIDGFFSYRKGWLLYTPLMVFSLLGFFYMRKRVPRYFSGTLLLFILSAYLTLSWWCWWYGGGFGLRALIDLYGLLAIPMGCFFSYMFEKARWKKIVFTILILLMIGFQLFQSNQYVTGSIHYDSMTKEAYWASFLKTDAPAGWHYLLKEPDYQGAAESGQEKP